MKLVKLSVAAAMAAGLATSASAVELTEAIKGVDINGYVRYRMESTGGDAARAATNNVHAYKVRVGATIPVNDDVNFKTTMGNGDASGTVQGDGEYGGKTDWGIIHAYFQYTGVENLVVQAGRQAMPTPFNDDEHGNGLVALYNVGPVTLAGGYFDEQNALADVAAANPALITGKADNHTNVAALGVIGSVEMVNFSAWYATHQDTFRAYTVDVNADIMDMVNVGLRHTELKIDNELADVNNIDRIKNKLTKLYASADIEMVNLRAQYVRTGTQGGLVAYDNDADTGFALEQLGIGNSLDSSKMTAYHLGAGATFGAVTAGVDYVRATQKDNDYNTATGKNKYTEIMPSVAYKMSDNFTVSALYSELTSKEDGADKEKTTLSRIQVMYTF